MTAIEALDAAWMREHPLPDPGGSGKDGRGQVLVVGGEVELAGAAMLAGVAALRAGAGKLQLAVAQDAVAALSVALPEARVLSLPRDGPDSARGHWTRLTEQAGHCDALLVGPGMMDDDSGLAAGLLAASQAIVVDAGALKAVTDAPPRSARILTPNAGEMAGLLGVSREKVEADPLAAGTQAAERFGAVVVAKGATTHVIHPDGRAGRYAGGGPGLGVSGSGDVLAGLIVGLLARGACPFDAAAWGVFLHGEAGARLASRIGRLGYLAREISTEAPSILSSF
ncbi:NAD(P)H-hydrate dehydratase [Caulobacter flavus]|uniref:ADP-dependent (S)-NAD(P)H-hydrate dehydratase n=1 Tax=Caulobacter flavus TaxID=1679497 RepID=A0A2N5CPA4_9CAUL|nr:NAD(P)H-hydrate dehydratase [Caulobacter flavus]AYV48527.1 NAD(P)H-hydrate dehydratase [Caulobacter flavus]PLR08758.1 NAD(P)H-hydrate dehydratase [Caulobacter flavus]